MPMQYIGCHRSSILLLAFVCGLSVCLISTCGHSEERNSEKGAITQNCPAENSLIAFLTRQAFDEGRVSEGRDYAILLQELAHISVSGYRDNEIVEKSIIAATTFANTMKSKGHDVSLGDLIIHRETRLNSSLRDKTSLSPIYRAQLELQLDVNQEMKRVVCR